MWTRLLCAALVVAICYRKYLDYTRDVPPEYLAAQSVVDSTRHPNELAVYKSTKLDYSAGLRVGLGIRYDVYKLRNGNMCDVWEVAMRAVRADPARQVSVGGASVSLAYLNGAAAVFARHLRGVRELRVPRALFVADPQVLAVVVGCLLERVTVHVHDAQALEKIDGAGAGAASDRAADVNAGTEPAAGESCEVACLARDGARLVFTGSRAAAADDLVARARESPDFDNPYTPAKDRGIALRVSAARGARAATSTAFTQGNLVAALASCLRHLPPSLALSNNDRVAVVQDSSMITVPDTLVKALAALMAHAHLCLAPPAWDYLAWRPSVVNAPAAAARALLHLVPRPTSVWARAMAAHRRQLLARLRFSAWGAPAPVRLLLVFHDIGASEPFDGPAARVRLGAHVVQEWGYFLAAGPVVLSDVYDYRELPPQVARAVRGAGAVVQSNELKLINYNGADPGTLCVRGYNIGKATTTMVGVGSKQLVPDAEDFYPLPVQARWGSDGCLYLMKSI